MPREHIDFNKYGVQVAVKERDEIPIFTVDQLAKVPANSSVVTPIVDYFTPKTPVIFRPFVRNLPTMELIHRGINSFVPDYRLEKYIDQDQTTRTPENLPQLKEELEAKLLKDTLEKVAKAQKENSVNAIGQAKIEETTAEVRRKIEKLVDYPHRVRHTYRVGQVTATEVFPERRVDPLFCLSSTNPRLDRNMNNFFQAAFVNAFIGRVNDDETIMRQAYNAGVGAGASALNACLKIKDHEKYLSMAELLFVSELVYNTGFFVVNGIAHLF